MSPPRPPARETGVQIPCAGVTLHGDLAVPAGAKGLVIFAHDWGSSRLSPRNRLVASQLLSAGLATLLFDLLSPREAAVDQAGGLLRFDLPLLAGRLRAVSRWAQSDQILKPLRLGYFGAGTGAATALAAAADEPVIHAVVCRGGRTDLADDAAERVRSPVLMIVGELDPCVANWNRRTMARLPGVKELAEVPGASHRFAEPGALEQVAGLAARWFINHLTGETARK